jgi:hypothetical protein
MESNCVRRFFYLWLSVALIQISVSYSWSADMEGIVAGASAGDCIQLETSGAMQISVPLEGIFCEPPSSENGNMALESVKAFIVGKRVVVRGGDIFFNGNTSLSHSLLLSGLARSNDKDQEHMRLEGQAKGAGRGIWREVIDRKPAPEPKFGPIPEPDDDSWNKIVSAYQARNMRDQFEEESEADKIYAIRHQELVDRERAYYQAIKNQNEEIERQRYQKHLDKIEFYRSVYGDDWVSAMKADETISAMEAQRLSQSFDNMLLRHRIDNLGSDVRDLRRNW